MAYPCQCRTSELVIYRRAANGRRVAPTIYCTARRGGFGFREVEAVAACPHCGETEAQVRARHAITEEE